MNLAKLSHRTYINCPSCNEPTATVDHLMNQGDKYFGYWYCDHCGDAYTGHVKNGIDVYVELVPGKRQGKCYVFLRRSNVLYVINHWYWDGKLDQEHMRYFFEEHTCPTNFIRIAKIVDLTDGDDDPHGIFEFITAVKCEDLSDEEPDFYGYYLNYLENTSEIDEFD